MIEAMACGTPVLALPGGAVNEIVADGVNGWICANVTDMAQRARDLRIPPTSCRSFVEEHFSAARMAADYEKLYRACTNAPDLTSSAGASALNT
jgi:glycosyltransferase involved in cell wall biosynthesis